MPDFAYLASVAVFTFGALTLSVLTAYYWSQGPPRAAHRSTVLPVFTAVCAAAFLNNLFYQTGLLQSTTLVLVRNVLTGLIPLLMLHLVAEFTAHRPSRRLLIAVYATSAALTAARGLNETGILSTPASGALYFAPAALLAVASLLAMLLLVFPRHALRAKDQAHRRALLFVLVPMLICGAANLGEPAPLMRQMPDYLVLAFLCVTLYFRERMAFIDLLVKRGTFFAAGLVILAAYLSVGTLSVYATGALLLAFWLGGPAIYARIDRLVDSAWLRRPYSAADAERQFIRELQAANTEDELRALAARSLGAIFRTKADVELARRRPTENAEPEDGSLATRVPDNGSPGLSILLAPRSDGIPFLSDDRRLLQSLAGTLGVILENVHFRAATRSQEQREQQLRWLTSRAELKALRAQINPHFLFNALSAITGLVHQHPELAAETIEELAQVFRYALRKPESEWAPLSEEVEFVTAYLRVEQARFGERLRLDLHVDPAAAGIPIPAMSIQPLIENAIHHGIACKEEGGLIGLKAVLQKDLLSIEVSDSGPGFPPGFSMDQCGEGHGLRNVKDRLQGYYGGAAHLQCGNDVNRTWVVLTLPQAALCEVSGRDASDTRTDRR